eukprot:CAMPEP_0198213360 /NCGR_PEP_ID=MMETSP1445-20131203/28815_1 /TAXON_ID=36898 /ORGANISM="Pyramimonas sp., Strain CCMP2087" /LENGTH=330 /DNA_ID=CAMNT_0043887987 /DNA_START=97 /DNA_END=1089 /DNA_ORIENTATION=-
MGGALAATPGSARCCPGQVMVVSQQKKATARFHAARPLAASVARVFSRRRQHAVQPRLLACRPVVASASIAVGEEDSTRKGSAEVVGDMGRTWPDGTFKGDWETWECPPKERPDIYAPPTYHGARSKTTGARVQVRVYMIDRFGLSRVGRAVLKKEFNAIWHVGVVVHDREYNFADKVAYMTLDGEDLEAQSMHGFAASHVYEVGNTAKTKEELDHFVFNVLPSKFNISQYCSFTNNCHNFSNDLVEFLTGKEPSEGGFPQWCLDHGGCALSNLPDADADTIRLASNKIAKVMMVSFGKFNRERVKILEGGEWISGGDLSDKYLAKLKTK